MRRKIPHRSIQFCKNLKMKMRHIQKKQYSRKNLLSKFLRVTKNRNVNSKIKMKKKKMFNNNSLRLIAKLNQKSWSSSLKNRLSLIARSKKESWKLSAQWTAYQMTKKSRCLLVNLISSPQPSTFAMKNRQSLIIPILLRSIMGIRRTQWMSSQTLNSFCATMTAL